MAEPTSALPTQPTPIPIFKGDGYEFWSIRMKTILRSRDLWDLVATGVNNSETDPTKLRTAQKKDAHAMAIMQQAVHDQLFSRIAAATSARETWEILRLEYEGDDQVKAIKLQGLRRDFENLSMKDNESVGDYFSRVMGIVSQKRAFGEMVTDQSIVEKVLRSLSSKFDHIVPSIEVSLDLSQLTPVKLMGSLQSQEARINSRSGVKQPEADEEQALQVIQEPYRGPYQPAFRGRGRGSVRGRGRGRTPERNKGPKCYVCNKFGHVKKDCWYNDEPQAQVANEDEVANPAEDQHLFLMEANEPFLLMTNSEENRNNLWFIDSGCSNHMTGIRESFIHIDESFILEVNLGNKKKLEVAGKGTVKIILNNGDFKLLEDVYFAPKLEYNLLSVGQLMRKGYALTFDEGKCVIRNKTSGLDLLSVTMAGNNMFILDTNRAEAQTAEVSQSQLWHKRYGHYHYKGLKVLSEKLLVRGLPTIKMHESCEGCIMGKQHKLPFKSTAWRSTETLGLIHADLCGAMQTPSLGGNLYYFLLIDDYTRMCWVYFLSAKSQTFSKFKAFKAMVETESGYKIKVLRTDRGGEFCSNEFNSFCESNGIKRELTIPYTPEHNGVVERKNRTIMEMTRSMLKEKQLPNYLWAEGVATSIYLTNRTLTKAIKDTTPFEAWYGEKPTVHHLRVFGCITYKLVPSQHRRKLDSRAEKNIFIGYSSQCKGYRLFNPITKKFTVERNVTFIEGRKWHWESNNESQKEPSDPFPSSQFIENDIDSTQSTPPIDPPAPTAQNTSSPLPSPLASEVLRFCPFNNTVNELCN
ncbi:hypothetical protein E3N88_42566 [Mikania micrantha]|uniref:Integrase catalytic domain-containing protein n=1 Tax=Mikania micrantha TaxID=192012 RepID=A0A5N6LHD7_9ASTR|nr:hypothetical protein E3N88_42566 [Mikania micrantha]